MTIVEEQKKFACGLYGFLWIKLYGVQIELIKCDFFFVFVYNEMDMRSTLIIHSQSEIFVYIESELIERSFTADDKIVPYVFKVGFNWNRMVAVLR